MGREDSCRRAGRWQETDATKQVVENAVDTVALLRRGVQDVTEWRAVVLEAPAPLREAGDAIATVLTLLSGVDDEGAALKETECADALWENICRMEKALDVEEPTSFQVMDMSVMLTRELLAEDLHEVVQEVAPVKQKTTKRRECVLSSLS
jgi:hypothetical protein